MDRRQTLSLMVGGALSSFASIATRPALAQSNGPAFTLPPLGYAFEALEPHIDATTMRIHHDNHHAAYINNLNTIAGKWPDITAKPVEMLLSDLSAAPADVRTGVRNNLGGHWNHTFFWELMTPGGANAPTGDIQDAINTTFGDVAAMKAALKAAALARFGSGWAWLAVDKDNKLTILSTANQDTPHVYSGTKPILGVDVWEHAYYLKYQSKRADYVDAWWNTVNWDRVAANLRKARAL